MAERVHGPTSRPFSRPVAVEMIVRWRRKSGSSLFTIGHKRSPTLCRIPDILRRLADIVSGLSGETSASIGSLAQTIIRAGQQIGGRSLPSPTRRATTSNLYRYSPADVRHGSQAPKVQPKSWESEGVMPLGTVPLSARVSNLLGFESPERRSAASYERELAAHKSHGERAAQGSRRQRDSASPEGRRDPAAGDVDRGVPSQAAEQPADDRRPAVAAKPQEANAETASRLSTAAERVRAIAGLHHHLHSMDGTPTVEFKPYLDRLCRDHSTMSMSDERPDQVIAVDAIELSLPTTIGIPLSPHRQRAGHQRHQARQGRITVTLAPAGKGHALSVSNDGAGLPEGFDPTACKGLGMKLVSSLATQIGGELRIDRGDDGDCTRFTVLFA